jgi:hypothetical protein
MIFFRKNLFFILLFWSTNSFGQHSIIFTPTIEQDNLELNKGYFIEKQKDSIQLSSLKFYISDITFWQNKKLVHALEKKHFLLDLEKPSSFSIPLNTKESLHVSSIKFNLGIDSTTNVSGALGGDLDPTNGMYWTWQNGYINFKMEGTSANCPARKNKFQFHLGGYLEPYDGLREIELTIPDQKDIVVELDLSTFFNSIDLSTTYQIMSPSDQAMKLASKIQKIFLTKE